MSKETVNNIELDKYLFLVDFHKNIEEGNVVQVFKVDFPSYRVFTKENAFETIASTLKNSEEKNVILERKLEKYDDFDIEENKRLKAKNIELENKLRNINILKSMTIWQFLKFRKSKK